MLNYLDFALRAIVLKYFFELASYFYMSFIWFYVGKYKYWIEEIGFGMFIRIQDLLYLSLLNKSL